MIGGTSLPYSFSIIAATSLGAKKKKFPKSEQSLFTVDGWHFN